MINLRISIKNGIQTALTASAICLAANSASAAYPTGYYDSLEGKCGAELMRAVKAAVKDHTVINYGSGTWDAFKDTDVRTIDGVDYWWDMYSNELLRVSDGRPNSNVMNVEHSVPNSWWGKTKNAAYQDIVHLNPSDSKANSRKSNYPLAELSYVDWTNGVSSVGTPKSGQGGGNGNAYEPADEYKGDFARAYMYMFTVYDEISWKSGTYWMYDPSLSTMFKTWASQLLLKWSANDPVSEKERVRNDGIYLNQKNRNPFIDLPDLAEHIWGSKSNVPFSLDGTGPEDPEDPEDPEPQTDVYTWLEAGDADEGEWTFENIELAPELSYVWSWKIYKDKGYLNASAYMSKTAYRAEAYAWSPEISLKNVVDATFSFSHAAKFQTTLRTLCKLVVKDVATGEISEIEMPTWPEPDSWTFVNSGKIGLSEFADRDIKIGFLYGSSSTGADTWEIRDARLELKRSTGVCMTTPDEDDSDFVEVWGNNIYAPDGARIFDLNGREYDGRNMQPGVYIVAKPTFSKSVKVMVK